MTMPEPKLKIGDTVVLKRRWLLSIREECLTAQVEAYQQAIASHKMLLKILKLVLSESGLQLAQSICLN